MAALINELGKRYSRLTVVKQAAANANGRVRWQCRCDCGRLTTVDARHLRDGNTRSCGCLAKEKTRERLAVYNELRAENKRIVDARKGGAGVAAG